MLYVSNVLVYWSEDVLDECSYYINRNTDIWKPYTEHAQHKRQTRAHDLNRIHSTAICTCESWLNSQECRRSVRFIISPENRTQHHLIVPHKLCRNYVRKKTHTHTLLRPCTRASSTCPATVWLPIKCANPIHMTAPRWYWSRSRHMDPPYCACDRTIDIRPAASAVIEVRETCSGYVWTWRH